MRNIFLLQREKKSRFFFTARKIITLNNHINSQLNNTLELFQMWQRKLFFRFFFSSAFSSFPAIAIPLQRCYSFFSQSCTSEQDGMGKKAGKEEKKIRVLFWQECAFHWVQCGGKIKLAFKLNK
jgi:hypothetical protein